MSEAFGLQAVAKKSRTSKLADFSTTLSFQRFGNHHSLEVFFPTTVSVLAGLFKILGKETWLSTL